MSDQFDEFLQTINRALDISLRVVNKLKLRFGHNGTPRPRYFLQSKSQESLNIQTWPHLRRDDAVAFNSAPPASQHAWLDDFDVVTGESEARRKQEKENSRTCKAQERKKLLEDAQKLLRLRGGGDIPATLLIAVDVEALERPPNPVSEIGFAILDTKDIQNIPPGPGGSHWWPKIKAHHLRVREYSSHRNHQFVQGWPANFDFG